MPPSPAGVSDRRVPPLVRATGAALVAVVLVLLATLAGALGAQAAEEDERPLLVFIGTTGLRWNGIGEVETPVLWDLAHQASLGENAVRSVRRLACPADGWLAISSGKRAADAASEDGTCRTLVQPVEGSPVPGWQDYAAEAEAATYGARLGTLGQAVLDGGVRAAGIGPGAAIALADPTGVPVGEHAALPASPAAITDAVTVALVDTDFLVVDVGTVRDRGKATTLRPLGDPNGATTEEPTRLEQVQAVDERLGAVLSAIDGSGRTATVIFASIADSGREPRLQAAAALGPAVLPGTPDFGDSLLGSRSTRQEGIIQTTDLAPSLLRGLDLTDLVPPGTLVGAPIQAVAGGARMSPFAAVLDIGRHAIAVTPLIPPFFVSLVFINLIFYLLVAVGLNSWVVATLRTRAPVEPRFVLRSLSVAGVSIASIPVASYLANAVPWWRSSAAGWVLFGLMIVIIGLITVLTLLPRWGRNPTAPIAVVGGITMAVLCYEALTGGTLQVSAVMGAPPTVAGRFYGINNQAFALLATSSVLVAAVAADPLVRGGRRRLAALVIATIGVVVTVLNGAPGFGADFGGPPSLVPAFFLFALMALGVRITWLRVLGVLATGALVVSAIALVDWLRPEEDRTHLGRFVDTVLDGGLWDVIVRKADQNLSNLGGTWLTLLALGGIALVVLVLMRPIREVANAPDGGPYNWLSGGTPLRMLGQTSPMLGSALITLVVVLGLGFALNDSGIVIPAIGVSLAVPLLVAVSATWMLQTRSSDTPPQGPDAPDRDLVRR